MQLTAQLTCPPYELILSPLSDIEQIGKTHPRINSQPVPGLDSTHPFG